MDETFEITRILSAIEINLCMRALGFDDWDDIPMFETEAPPEKRMLEGFINLAEMGILKAAGDKFEVSPAEREIFDCIGSAEKKAAVSAENGFEILYGKGDMAVLLDVNYADPMHCRICTVPSETFDDEKWTQENGEKNDFN